MIDDNIRAAKFERRSTSGLEQIGTFPHAVIQFMPQFPADRNIIMAEKIGKLSPMDCGMVLQKNRVR
jgi:hypothetical protein